MKQVYGYFMSPVNLMGAGAVEEIGDQLKKLKGTKALIVTDEDLVELGIVEEVTEHIKKVGIDFVVFDGVQPNPTVSNVEAGLELLEEENCDIVVSVGGGSPHDCAKGIAIVATNGGEITDYEGLDQSTEPMMPLISVNTTAGTASEMTRFAVITDEERQVKMAIADWRVTPNVAINDPLLMMKKPPALTAATGMDALTHAVEAYVSTDATPVTDSAAIKAIELVAENLREAVANGDNFEARDNMAYAEFLAGMAFNNASLGFVHAMAHQLGGFYDLPHGVCNAILLPHVEGFNLIANPGRLADIAETMGENIEELSTRAAADKALEAITTLSKDIGIPQRLSDLEGVKKEDFDTLAENALKDVCSSTNPRKATKEEIIGIFESAY
ncbi:iron-containing alcohol dehydrogenase [Acetohalobium arabaticum]|uniref:Iron-containing alcohol dehydrogenase n=1 Tax=Acetohalobium arabaticum (strain ATCC 49924 / DSM 5501 / Z-7288) TaxID=574087 RepID=D9QPR8_ACEAZ|nr:iron-containing alcohol dehydrogenase [Acetohalobium arabaticum]ADL12509.1 iron-containing alcohol dehydrogenase [Acetohalobium arabaticum DSM 5501]